MKLLKEDPAERLNAKDALQHPWFQTKTETTNQGGIGANMTEFN